MYDKGPPGAREQRIWDEKTWGSLLGCVGSASERLKGSAGQGRAGQAGGLAGWLRIRKLGTYARMKHLITVEWWMGRVYAVGGTGWNED